MGKRGVKKKVAVHVVLDESIQDHGNDPAVQRKAKEAADFLKKQGVPKSFDKKIKSRP
jgi:hypothetical protein